MLARLTIPRRELGLLLGAVAFGVALRVAFVLITRHQGLAGDELEYDADGRLIAAGHWFWSTAPYGIPHPSAWKAPGYVAWVGILYSLLGAHQLRVELVQAVLCGPLTICLTFVLGRRLFGARTGLVAAWLVAAYPLAWQYDVRLYSESLATPLTLVLLIVFLERTPTARRSAAAGALAGLLLLIRPTSVFLLVGLAVAWVLAAGLRRGAVFAALSIAVAAVVVVPWTIRNYDVVGGFIPISVQDAAAYGTFNATSAGDPVWPYAWRPTNPRDADLFDPRHPLGEVRLRSELQKRARKYIAAHPFSVVEAFFWNGLSRLWDVRRPSRALTEVRFEGRSRALTIAGLGFYYVLAPLAMLGLWRLRSRRGLVLPLVAIALTASVVFTIDSGTRYRAPLEPVIALLACSAALGLAASLRRAPAPPCGRSRPSVP
jgi:4-amino-4-deoxy-L-arabinose transferase-like glycosyltransferase